MNLRIETLYPSDNRVLTHIYGFDGNLRARTENYIRASEYSKTIFDSNGNPVESTIDNVLPSKQVNVG